METPTLEDILEYYEYSAKRLDDRQCGDSKKILYLPKKEQIVFTCSDGVGGHPGHYLASRISCESFIDAHAKSQNDVTESMRAAVYEAHKAVKHETDGAMATLVAVVYSIPDKSAHYLSVGDSAIFLIKENVIQKLTTDDFVIVPIRFNNRFLASDGVVTTSGGLTKVLGQKSKFDFEINQIIVSPGDAIVLATDGVHANGPLSESIFSVLESSDISSSLKQFIADCAVVNNDDSTAVVFISKDFDTGYIDNYYREIMTEVRFPLYSHSRLLAKLLANKLLARIVLNEEWNMMAPVLEYLSSSRIHLAKSDLVGYFTASIRYTDERTSSLLRGLIQRA